ncbi:MAG: hypothetical protein WC693_05830 [Patescibacteria group bacterium]|jgi:hypothetical protein
MDRQFVITEICKHIRSHRDRRLGACIDIIIPWGNSCQLSVRVERMTGKCINLHTDMEMLTIDPQILDAAFAGKAVAEQTDGPQSMGAYA